MRLPRMTTRRWMVAVAVVGIVLGATIGGFRLKRRHEDLLFRMRHHQALVEVCREGERNAQDAIASIDEYVAFRRTLFEGRSMPLAPFEESRSTFMKQRVYWSKSVAFHEAMKSKYRRAARYPWLPVEPDPAGGD